MLISDCRGDRRAYKRHDLEEDRGLWLVAGRHSVGCKLGDVSATGVGVVVSSGGLSEFPVGRAVELRCPDGGMVPAEVVHRGGQAIGLKFLDGWVAAAFWYKRILSKLRPETATLDQ